MCLSNKNNILVAGNTNDKDLTIWDYELLRLYEVLKMSGEITSVLISDAADLIIAATNDMKITMIKFVKKEHCLDLKIVSTIDLALN
jgi:hypothetical protein